MKGRVGESAYKSLMMIIHPSRTLDMFFRAAHRGGDDVTTKDKKETRADIFDEAAKRTIASIYETSGPVVADWTWEKSPHPQTCAGCSQAPSLRTLMWVHSWFPAEAKRSTTSTLNWIPMGISRRNMVLHCARSWTSAMSVWRNRFTHGSIR